MDLASAVKSNNQAKAPSATHTPGDKRLKMLSATIKRYQYQQDALIEILHKAQELFGYLKKDVLVYIAHQLKLPPSTVYGVATFYHFFSLAPIGVHSCMVCTGTACYVKGAEEILNSLENSIHIRPGETSADGQISLLTARCLGPCGIAPVVVFDDTVLGDQTPESVGECIKGWLQNGSS
ncbi:bidirectional hydrogenase complex protein HoxE [Nodularia spumigena]|uniref:bidirectional hydrogenase complex protein HoxE n=1 Tax=Cyanophyceae TaxID=3028117 RepID=UPI00232DB52C|nr:bidirectional hydrogenase complex protein HoxE [Nodularia spumigena]MDB9358194.1 bidirectional hydrogenase complex protein HoxE [Nodularia spumigena CS-587/03]MDB9303207.1 bidirectional hydrogenase complex protein HoxE [Nodularia spumigena CS-591/12]MDB9317171.1 bidirectional hydrogenase complex protein HoxE [Nodularia spumigena CS-590/01A]MDB9321139.1 bidirectional hydrogenase complex protein HoxE [Nodularia spumigena CS-591/07A]MDB9327315.1 bidirectional hydrogenase complex protein HoxE [